LNASRLNPSSLGVGHPSSGDRLTLNGGALALGHELLVKLYWHGVLNLAVFPFACCMARAVLFLRRSQWMDRGMASLDRKHRNAMLLPLAGAVLVWTSMLRGWLLTAIAAPQFVMLAITFYVFALAGVFIGGFLLGPTPIDRVTSPCDG
jgi:hypothetical protein